MTVILVVLHNNITHTYCCCSVNYTETDIIHKQNVNAMPRNDWRGLYSISVNAVDCDNREYNI